MLEKLKILIPDSTKKILGYILVAAAIWVANHYFGTAIPEPQPPVWSQVGEAHYQFGWDNNPEAVEAVAGTLRFKVFADTPAGQVQDALPTKFYLWDVYRKCDPRGPPCKDQGQVGSCVSFGTNNAILRTLAADIVINNRPFELHDIVEEVTYGGSRVEIGGGKIRGDGSVGAWAAQFVQRYGVVARGVYGSLDLSRYDMNRCRQWGNAGVPAELEAVAKQHPVQDITQIKTWADAKRALSQGYGIAVCSSQGFTMRRDARGVCQPSGRWDHCMCIDGYHIDEGGKEYGHIENSWGANAFSGPTGWGNPSTAGFWADAAVCEKMIKAGDTWAFSGVKGFPARDSEWFVKIQPTRPVRVAQLTRRDLCVPFLLSP